VLDPSRLFLVASDDRLVGLARDLDGAGREERLTDLLAELTAGPTSAERDQQFSTALPPDVRLTLGGLSGGTATVDIGAPVQAPSGVAGRRAVAQIVLTATSVPGIDAVRLTLGGEPVEAPLLSGELTSAPLTAADYAQALTAPPSASPAPPAPSAVPAPPS
jgi:spore germination protein GerM